ncbi:MAG: DNA polymerase III subunit delta' C-terminal domain-containing protein [Buchnera aphidicola (Eriosoma harunire)]
MIYKKKNILPLFSFFSKTNSLQTISWISSLLLDILKNKYNLFRLIHNIDQILLIQQLSCVHSITNLNKIIRCWHLCYYQLHNIKNINYELIIIKQLLYWERILNTLE